MKHILIVEDDTALGEGVRLALQHPELEAVLCRTLAQARQALAARSFDLAVLDVNLPDGSGLELLRQIRLSSALPVILLTANDLETDIVAGLESGADDYITKPFSLAGCGPGSTPSCAGAGRPRRTGWSSLPSPSTSGGWSFGRTAFPSS